MRVNNRFIIGLLSILLAALIAFVVLPAVARRTNGKTEIIRVRQPVSKGEKISGECLEVVEVGSYNLPETVAYTAEEVEGFYAAADLEPGDYILSSKVSTLPLSSDAALEQIPFGKMAISFTVKTLASGLSNKLQPEDIIRIYHFRDVAEEVPELRFVEVLAVSDANGEAVVQTKKWKAATITVLASPEQARVITRLENEGMPHVALVSRNSEELATELLEEQEKILQEIYFTEEEQNKQIEAGGSETEIAEQENTGGENNVTEEGERR